jgi:hypothetical protein
MVPFGFQYSSSISLGLFHLFRFILLSLFVFYSLFYCQLLLSQKYSSLKAAEINYQFENHVLLLINESYVNKFSFKLSITVSRHAPHNLFFILDSLMRSLYQAITTLPFKVIILCTRLWIAERSINLKEFGRFFIHYFENDWWFLIDNTCFANIRDSCNHVHIYNLMISHLLNTRTLALGLMHLVLGSSDSIIGLVEHKVVITVSNVHLSFHFAKLS